MKMTRAEYKAAIQKIQKEEFEYCSKNLVYFASNYCYFEDKDDPEVVVHFRPWKEQVEALESIRDNRLNLFLKARQIGITWVALVYSAWDLLFHAGHTAIALSKTEEDAFELVRRLGVILSKLSALMEGGGATWKASKGAVEIIFDNGHKSVFKAFAASPSAGRSFTANILLIDEWAFQEYASEIWTAAYPTVNRPTGGKVIGISTIKLGTLFEQLWRQENNFKKIFISVFADPRRTPEWFAAVQRDMGEIWKQEYPRTAEEALANIGGRMFPTFDVQKHVCEPFAIPQGWKIYSAMDYGYDMLAHYKIAVDSERNCYVFHEIYKSEQIVSEAAELIKNADYNTYGPWTIPEVRLAPPDLFSRELTSGKNQTQGFYENGITLTKSSNNRESGWLFIKELLKDRKKHDGTSEPKLKIFNTCPNLIRTMQTLLVDEKNPRDAARQPHELTHAPDALRYFAIWWFDAAEDKSPEPKTAHWTAQMWEDFHKATPDEQEWMRKKWGKA